MGKFKVGDRVRAHEGNGWVPAGTEGTVAENDSVPFVDWDNGSRLAVSENKLSAVVPAWQPKVGDRVRFTDAVNPYWFFGPTKEHKDGVISNISTGDLPYVVEIGDDFGYVGIEHIEPITAAATDTAAAPLTIEAGKFYKTRDGRKVGPIARGRRVSDAWYWESPSVDLEYECAWYQNGSFFSGEEHKMDIIAEWVDEQPSVAVEASNDNAAPAKPAKFKVGDVVRFRDDYASSAAGNKAAVIAVNVWGTDGIQVDQGGYDGVSTEAEKDLELVVVATKFKVGDRIKGSAPGIGPVTGAIVEVDAAADDMTYFVLPDGNEYPFWVYNNTVEPADPAIPAIVALIEGGQPKPATKPKIHADQASATSEAERLALTHPGQEFGVFVLADSKIADEVITKTAVLRVAA